MTDELTIPIEEVTKQISRAFDVSGINLPLSESESSTLNELKKILTEKIRDLLDSNFNLLVNALYRIDVDEEKLNQLFGKKNRTYIPSALADLIIERQLQKIHFRTKYKQGKI